MKIAYILDAFPKISETFILNEILAMQDKGIEIEVFAFTMPKEKKVHSQTQKVNNVKYFNNTFFFKKIYAHFYWFFKNPIKYVYTAFLAINIENGLLKLFLLNLYDVMIVDRKKTNHIHAHFGKTASNMAMLINLLTGTPFTFTTHRYDIFQDPPGNYKIKSNLAKKHITISEFNKRYLLDKFGIAPDKIKVIHCGIDFQTINQKMKNTDANIILSVGRLDKQKGFDNLIKACLELKKLNIAFQCLIIGDGIEKTNLSKLIENLELTNNIFLRGSMIQTEVLDLLSTSKLFVLASRSEGIPVSLMEAMAVGVPVIGPKVTGVGELIEDGEEGFLVEPEQIKLLSKKIELLLNDAGLREKFIKKGYEKVYRYFNLKTETDKLFEIWNMP